ncbi:hypothetical protein HK098_008181 [Nowakowskiella sp. JEL0407]|nr:hypothetical protein HK098_008181 [Nowakowskiella sp. JEL0407]
MHPPATSLAMRRSAKARANNKLCLLTPLITSNSQTRSPTSHAPFSASAISFSPELDHIPQKKQYHHPLSAIPSDSNLFAYFNECDEQYYRHGPAQILPNLYLGSMHVVANRPLISSLNIKFVLNVAKEVDNPYLISPTRPSRYTSLKINTDVEMFSPRGRFTGTCNDMITSAFPQTPSPSSEGSTSPRKSLSENFEIISPEQLHSISPISPIPRFSPPTYKKLTWGHNHDSLISDFPTAFKYIDDAVTNDENVLVACQQGISRSASLVIAYVMKNCGVGVKDAYEFVKNRAPHICPNVSLVCQLAEFEGLLKDRKFKKTLESWVI